MSTYSNSLVIFILVAVILLENDAHHCGCHHKKTKKKCEKKTIATTPTPTPATIANCDPHTCNNESKPFCRCRFYDSIDNYPVPESGNCDDMIKANYSSTPIPSYLWCTKMRDVCSVKCICDKEMVVDMTPPTPTPTPTLCYTGTCNNATEPYCICPIDMHYPLPKDGSCTYALLMDATTTPTYYRFGNECTKMRTVCSTQCVCEYEDVVDHTATPTPTPMQTITNHM